MPLTAPRISRTITALALALALAVGTTLSAQVVYDEAVDGDLSNSAGAPTAVSVGPGSNIVSGTMINGTDTRDFLTFTIPAGGSLEELTLLVYEDLPSHTFGAVGYHAINAGSTSLNPSFGTANSFLGGNHLFNLLGPGDILPDLAAATTNGTGFTIPLGPGSYSYVIQQTGFNLTGYSLDFVVEDSWTDEGCALAGVNGDPLLDATGFLTAGTPNTLVLSNAAPSAVAGLFFGVASTPVAFKGGLLKPFPFFGPVILNTSASGEIPIPFSLPAGIPVGTELYIQYAIDDDAAVNDVALSNAVRGVTS